MLVSLGRRFLTSSGSASQSLVPVKRAMGMLIFVTSYSGGVSWEQRGVFRLAYTVFRKVCPKMKGRVQAIGEVCHVKWRGSAKMVEG